MDPTEVLLKPVITESTFNLIDSENKLVFIVDRRANKKTIREAMEKTYSVKCEKINTLITPTGQKKAYIKLESGSSASEVANKIGIF
jgi:large subunit ribosomal protein L23